MCPRAWVEHVGLEFEEADRWSGCSWWVSWSAGSSACCPGCCTMRGT